MLGIVGAVSTRRYRHRTRPLSFRRHRRLLVPLLLIGIVMMWGGAIAIGGRTLLLWDTWTVALLAVPLGITWIAGGIPGGVRVCPFRIVLLLVLAGVPATGILVPANGSVGAVLAEITVRGGDNAVEVEPHSALRDSDVFATSRDPSPRLPAALLVQVELVRRIPPLWWFPRQGWVETLIVEQHNSTGRHLFRRADARFSVVGELRTRFEQFLSGRGWIRRETRTLTIPDRPGWFLQPGRYTVQLTGAPPHPDTLTYRYTQQ